MCITTYLSDSDKSHFQETLIDRDIKESLRELNRIDGGSWIVRQTKHRLRKWFRSKESCVFSLYHNCNGGIEYQIVNFAPSDEQFQSINTGVCKQTILAYIHGMLAGLERTLADKESGQ